MLIPFSKDVQLSNVFDDLKLPDASTSTPSALVTQTLPLPDFPSIHLGEIDELAAFLKRDVCAPDLEKMAPWLWMMSTQSSAKIHSLHHQKVKSRAIIITEDPRLHLVWYHDRIFIKPLPSYLISHTFWATYLAPNSILGTEHDIVVKSALGYLRSYIYLIERPSDFQVAKSHGLVPRDVTSEEFALFAKALSTIRDSEVSLRYRYGELRLTRLNFHAKFILRRWYFQRMTGQYGDYFAGFYGPLLFVFTVFSLILNSLQVELAVEQLIEGNNGHNFLPRWSGFWSTSRYVAIIVLTIMVGLPLTLIALLLLFQIDELKFALTDRLKRRKHISQKPKGMGYR